MFVAFCIMFTSGCVLPSRSIKRARGPITPPPRIDVYIAEDGGGFELIPANAATYRYGKFINRSHKTSFLVEMTPHFQICTNCSRGKNPRDLKFELRDCNNTFPDEPAEGCKKWKTIERLTMSLNAISDWFRCPADRTHELRFSYTSGRQQFTDRTFLDPVFSTNGVICGGTHVDWCQWFDN